MEQPFRFNQLRSNYQLQLENGRVLVNRLFEAIEQECELLQAEGKISFTQVHDEFLISVHPSINPSQIAERVKARMERST